MECSALSVLWCLDIACLVLQTDAHAAFSGTDEVLGPAASHKAVKKIYNSWSIAHSPWKNHHKSPHSHPPLTVLHHTRRTICEYINMRLFIIVATFLAAVVTAIPEPLLQGYSGPCSKDNCGVNGLKCRSLCVGWPTTDPALREGCTCTNG